MIRDGKKYLIGMLLFFFILAVPSGNWKVWAEEENVFDAAGLLTDAESASLNGNTAEIKVKTGWNIFLLTTEDAEGKTPMEYADDFFDENSPQQQDGAVLLIDMDNREICISTCGTAIRYLTDERLDDILDEAYGYVRNGNYAECFKTMLNGMERYYDAGIPSGQYNYDVQTGNVSVHRSLTFGEILIAISAAIAAGAIVFFMIVGNYRLKFGAYCYDFRKNGKVNLTNKQDLFINEIVTHRHIPKQNSGGGGGGNRGRSSTHTSSSGRSHGGRSRSF